MTMIFENNAWKLEYTVIQESLNRIMQEIVSISIYLSLHKKLLCTNHLMLTDVLAVTYSSYVAI